MNCQYLKKSILKIAIFIITLPFLVVFFTVMYVHRRIVNILYIFFAGSKHGNLLCPQSSLFYSQQQTCPFNIHVNFKINGKIDFEAFCEIFIKNVLEAVKNNNHNNGKLLYPELKQYVKLWMGYNFWVEDIKFDINDHIKYFKDDDCESAIIKDDEFCESLIVKTSQLNFPTQKSPWLILIVNDIQIQQDITTTKNNNGTLVIFKFAHYLADGYSIFQLISKCADESKVTIYQPKAANKFETCVKYLCSPFSYIIKSSKPTSNLDSDKFWRNTLPGITFRNFLLSKQIPIINIRQVAKSLKVSFSSVLLCTFQKGLQSYFEKNANEFPDELAIWFTTPVPNHSKQLTNDLTYITEEFPTNKTLSFHSQIESYHQRLATIKNSSACLTRFVILHLGGLLPYPLSVAAAGLKCLWPKTIDILFTIFPGPEDEIHVLGHQVNEVNFFVHFSTTSPLYFSVFTYNGKLQFWLGCSTKLFTIEQSKEIMEFIETEFSKLN